MKNYVEPGEVLTFVVPAGGVVSGSLYKIGAVVCVATVTAAAGENAAFLTEGVVELPKVPNEPWLQGTLVYYNATNGLMTSVSAGNTVAGYVAANAANPSTTGRVKLNGGGF